MKQEKVICSEVGKRKTAVAKVFLTSGSGIIIVNNKPLEDFFLSIKSECAKVKRPFVVTNLLNKYDVRATVHGGGVAAQMEAIQLGIAKAICKLNIAYRLCLSQTFLLYRDARIKERRKYGLKKARKASQFTKR